jgi:hypothetical protein
MRAPVISPGAKEKTCLRPERAAAARAKLRQPAKAAAGRAAVEPSPMLSSGVLKGRDVAPSGVEGSRTAAGGGGEGEGLGEGLQVVWMDGG